VSRALAAAVLAGLLAGCGGASDSAGGPRGTLARYFAAVAGARPSAACAELTRASQARLAQLAPALGQAGGGCPAAMKAVFTSPYGHRLAALRHPRISSLDVHGNRATAHVDGVDGQLEMQRSAGRWGIDFTPNVEADKLPGAQQGSGG
jgi:hypothetical protein